MDLHIFPWREALAFEPQKPTYAIRICSIGMAHIDPPLTSPHYVHISTYEFNDLPKTLEQGLTEDLAKRIIEEFAHRKDQCEALLTHCTFGKNRSPAVAIALNDIFNLGHDRNDLWTKYPEVRMSVYNRLIQTAQTLGYTQ